MDNIRYYEERNGLVEDVANMSYAYDPASKEALVDSEVPLNEKGHTEEVDLKGAFPNCDSIVSTRVSSKGLLV